MINDWKECFPQNYVPRQIQQQSINFILDAFFEKNKKYCIIQAPTGTGKSYIATTIAQYFKKFLNQKSYILTPQIILQNQYKKQFPEYSSVSSRSNYKCLKFPKNNCAEIKLLHEAGKATMCNECIYLRHRDAFINNSISITNIAYFISNSVIPGSFITKRKFLFVDEAHNLEQQILRHIQLTLNFKTLHKQYGMEQSQWITEKQNVLDWVYKKLYFWLQNILQLYKNSVVNSRLALNQSKTIDIHKKIESTSRLIRKLKQVFQNFEPQSWVVQNNLKQKKILFKPLYAKKYANDMIFRLGQKVLLMSGTILDKNIYCKNLGINLNDVQFISLDSPFPIQNRAVYVTNSGSMSRRNIDKSLPKVVRDIKRILELHYNDKGIIHVSSHFLAKRIKDSLNDNRIMIVDDFQNRDQMLNQHYESHNNNTVLISPSLMQGVDLKDQLSRFQIIAKIPFPNLGDKYISTKKNMVPNWYSFQTAKTIVQSYGRSIRSQSDYAMTYILDSDFNFFYKLNNKLLPKYFKEAIKKTKLS